MPPQQLQQQQQQQQPNNQPGGKSSLASRKEAPLPRPPGKDFVEKNKSKAVQKEQEKGSYKNIAMKNGKVKNEQDQPMEVKSAGAPKQSNKFRRSNEAGLIEARTTASDTHHVKVDINLNIPPEQLAAMLGIDPSNITPRHRRSNVTRSLERKSNVQSKSAHEMHEPQLSNRLSHENGVQGSKKRNVHMANHEPLINNYTNL